MGEGMRLYPRLQPVRWLATEGPKTTAEISAALGWPSRRTYRQLLDWWDHGLVRQCGRRGGSVMWEARP